MIIFENIKHLDEDAIYAIFKNELKTFNLDNKEADYVSYFYNVARLLKQSKYDDKKIKNLLYENKELFS